MLSDMLTPGNLRVANKVALGLTNKQIARELDISEDTIRWHLTCIYKKLGIVSRYKLMHLILHEHYCKEAGRDLKIIGYVRDVRYRGSNTILSKLYNVHRLNKLANMK